MLPTIRTLIGLTILTSLAVLCSADARDVGWNFDTGTSPAESARLLAGPAAPQAPSGSILRMRGVEVPKTEGERRDVRGSLEQLRNKGYRLVAHFRYPASSWPGGVRVPAQNARLPKDLRDAFERARALAAAYGDLIDDWEIDNEPDISFVPDNAETYTAYLKACYLGVTEGKAEKLKPETLNEHPGSATQDVSSSGVQPAMSRVLMAPLALPPGPYFEDFVRNGGLSYTDGFNYHYYGYAEDFTGVYRQFESAVQDLAGPAADSHKAETLKPETPQSVFRTRFYPDASTMTVLEVGNFSFPASATVAERQAALQRPRAAEEPALRERGRWLTTDGVTVEEVNGTWWFTVDHWPAGPIRAPMAELPLPAGWSFPSGSLFTFEYRAVDLPGPKVAAADAIDPAKQRRLAENAEERKIEKDEIGKDETRQVHYPLQAPFEDPKGDTPLNSEGTERAERRRPNSASRVTDNGGKAARDLPVFLTETGYALDKVTRDTAEARERQRAWIASVESQVRELGIEGAMYFQLMPYLEINLLEFGLLERNAERGTRNADSGTIGNPKVVAGNALFPGYTVSPALEQILRDGRQPLRPHRWRVATPPPSDVVIDFVAGAGLTQAKTYGGYLFESGRRTAGDGELVVYNFGPTPVSGELRLDGGAWSFAGTPSPAQEETKKAEQGSSRPDAAMQPFSVAAFRAAVLTLAPGERRVIPVVVLPQAQAFVACAVSATFTPGPSSAPELSSRAPWERPPAAASPQPSTPAHPTTPPAPLVPQIFECYFRTANGNLYQTWPRAAALPTWQRYMQREEDFTMTFWGRARLPWRLSDNPPGALVFFFHPTQFPATYEVRAAQTLRFVRR